MIEPGRYFALKILREVSQGVYLNTDEGKPDEDVLLPKKQVPSDAKIGDEIEVFIYKDSKDRIIATVNTPALTVGEVKMLKAVHITEIGAFLDWGLEKDLLLPFSEQKWRVQKGHNCFVGLYLDKSNRLCATMHIYDMLKCDSPYKMDDEIEGTVYNINEKIGVFVAVDDKYHGLIPNHDLFRKVQYGDTINARIKEIRTDGKLILSLRKAAHSEIDGDAETIMRALEKKQGFLQLNDKSNPETIKRNLAMSKAAFKRAVGRLLKQKKIEIVEKGIKIKEMAENG